MIWLAILLVLIIIASRLIDNLRKRNAETPTYSRKESILTETERSFYAVLHEIIGKEYLLFPQVSLLEILSLPKASDRKNYYTALNRIQSKHIDFLVCEGGTMKPLLAIELDDWTHSRPDRIRRDDFLDEAFGKAGMPLLHVKASHQYDIENIRTQIQSRLHGLTPADKSTTLN